MAPRGMTEAPVVQLPLERCFPRTVAVAALGEEVVAAAANITAQMAVQAALAVALAEETAGPVLAGLAATAAMAAAMATTGVTA